jgi:HPt (histidine-containing phosphotransfer) domain-containing protein
LERWLAPGKKTPGAGSCESTLSDAARPVFDSQEFAKITLGNADLARRVILIFLKDTPGRIDAMKAAFAQGQKPDVERLAHSVKGSAITLGGARLSGIAAEIENASKAGRSGALELLLPGLDHEFGLLKAVLEKFKGPS